MDALRNASPTVVSATAIAYAPLTEELAAAYADGRVILHSVDPATADRVLSEAGPPATAIAFSPNGKLLAEAHGAGVSLRRLQDGQVLATIDGKAQACGTPTQLGFSPDGSRLLGLSAGAICVWRTDSAALVAMATEAFTAAALTNGSVVVGRRLSTGGLAVEALALPSLTRTAIPVQPAAAPALADPSTLVISPMGDSFVAIVRTGTDRSLMLWDGAGATLVTRSFGESRPVVFSPDGRHVLLSDAIVNARTGAIERDLPYMRGLYRPVMLNADGTRLAGLGTIGDIVVPDVSDAVSGIELRVFATLPGPSTKTSNEPLWDMSMSANGQLLAISDQEKLMLFRIAPNFAKSAAIQSATRCSLPFRISLSPDGEMLLCSGDGWNLSRTFTGEVVDTLPPPDVVSSDYCNWTVGSLSPRGTWLAIADYGPSFNVRPVPFLSASGTEVPSARCNGSASFNADESLMATTGPELYRTSDWTRIWPADLTSPAQNNSPFSEVLFLPGGRELVVSLCGTTELSGDVFNCAYALYSADTGHTVRQLPALTAHKAAVSAEGHWIVSGPTLQHLPTGALRTLELDGQAARLSIFTPNGDIIASMPDNTLVRYCRSDRAP